MLTMRPRFDLVDEPPVDTADDNPTPPKGDEDPEKV